MVKDVPGQEDEAALEFGVDFGLQEGEELPKDHEQLSEAQFTVFQMLQTLKGTFEQVEAETIMGEKGTGLIIPD